MGAETDTRTALFNASKVLTQAVNRYMEQMACQTDLVGDAAVKEAMEAWEEAYVNLYCDIVPPDDQ